MAGWMLPQAFTSIGILPARYLMNIGAFCALFAAMLGALLPASRQLRVMAEDGVLPRCLSVFRQGKSGAPLSALIACGVASAFCLIFVQKERMLMLVPINLILRLMTLVSFDWRFCMHNF